MIANFFFFFFDSLAALGVFVNVFAYKAKPSSLIKHQLIQYHCSFLVIAMLRDFFVFVFLTVSFFCLWILLFPIFRPLNL